MSEPTPLDRERALVRDYLRIAAERAKGEREADVGFGERLATAEKQIAWRRSQFEAQADEQMAQTEREYVRLTDAIAERFATDSARFQEEWDAAKAEVEARYKAALEAA